MCKRIFPGILKLPSSHLVLTPSVPPTEQRGRNAGAVEGAPVEECWLVLYSWQPHWSGRDEGCSRS